MPQLQNPIWASSKKLGVDVSRLQAIGDKYDSDQQWEATVLNDEQIIALLPMVKSMNDVEIEGGYDIEAAKAMPGGHTMLIFAVEYGDSGAELMGIYDRDAISPTSCSWATSVSSAPCSATTR